MSVAASAPASLLVLFFLAASIWVGGLFAIFVVARVSASILEADQRVSLFRGIGRSYGLVGGGALLVAVASGALLLRDRPWSGELTAAAILTAALLGVTAAGVAQARAMTRLRERALEDACGRFDAEVHRPALLAAALRAAIALLTLALVVLGAELAR